MLLTSIGVLGMGAKYESNTLWSLSVAIFVLAVLSYTIANQLHQSMPTA